MKSNIRNLVESSSSLNNGLFLADLIPSICLSTFLQSIGCFQTNLKHPVISSVNISSLKDKESLKIQDQHYILNKHNV